MNSSLTKKNIVQIMLVGTLVAMGVLAYKVAEPYLTGIKYTAPAEVKLELPKYDTKAWAEWPVLEDGRVKPLQTVAIETVRQITGRATLDGQPAMNVFLSWIFYRPKGIDPSKIDWDNYPFILCEDHDLRAAIYGVDKDEASVADKVHGKRISPMDLHKSVGFQRLVVEVNRKRQLDEERYQQQLEPMERKANAVNERLRAYEMLTGSLESRGKPAGMRESRMLMADPVHYVALDKVPDSSWFSMGELRFMTTVMRAPMLSQEENANLAWADLLRERVALQPRLYLDETARKSLAEFQAALKAGQAEPILVSVEAQLRKAADDQLEVTRKKTLLEIDKMSDDQFKQTLISTGRPTTTKAELKKDIAEIVPADHKETLKQVTKAVDNLRQSVKTVRKPYIVDDPRTTSYTWPSSKPAIPMST
ncbi:MAG: hypothetical protein QM703_13150 [Gemmatales bacterium]